MPTEGPDGDSSTTGAARAEAIITIKPNKYKKHTIELNTESSTTANTKTMFVLLGTGLNPTST